MEQRSGIQRTMTLLALTLAVWGGLGLIQIGDWGDGGYANRLDGSVAYVAPDGPADAAGLEVGDVIVAIGDVQSVGFWKKPFFGGVGNGETQSLVVQRQGQRASVQVVWGPASSETKRSHIVRSTVALAFLGFGVWAMFAAGTTSGLLLAALGIAYAGASMRLPNLGIPGAAIAFMQSNLSLLLTALLAHFLLIYPYTKKIFRSGSAVSVFYLPFLVYFGIGLVGCLTYPALRSEFALAAMITDLLYMSLAFLALIHSWIRIPHAERNRVGFHWIPVGLTIAIGPFILLALIRIGVSDFSIPAEQYLPLAGVGIPAGLACAAVIGSRTQPNAEGK